MSIFALLIIAAFFLLFIFGIVALIIIIRTLLRAHKANQIKQENAEVRKTLAQTIKENRIRCNMTQEFVAESIGVSRQAVSKWENGTSDPSTSNLCALATLFQVNAEELLRNTSNSVRSNEQK